MHMEYCFYLPSASYPNVLMQYYQEYIVKESALLPYTESKRIYQVEKPSCSAVEGTAEWTYKHLLAQPVWIALRLVTTVC